jgi:2-(1,2-epoxy-1,2-dihydrophenyl)acetyl-CoA isomerase
MTADTTVLVTRPEGYRRLALNRPERLNAFNAQLHAELIAALREAEADADCRAVMLTGTGRGFCAGQDLNERVFTDGITPDLSENLVERYNPLVSFIRSMRLPVVAAVNGVAAGAGAGLAFACDIVLAARSAKFTQSFARIGLIPDAGSTWTLPRLAGDARARAMFMLAQSIDAERAEQWGMIWKAVDDDRLEDEAASICRALAATPGEAIALTKRALEASATSSLAGQLSLEAELQRQAGAHPDYRAAVESFRRKS